MKYRVREALLAIASQAQVRPVYITIEPGSVITVKGIEEESGFVDVFYRGEMVKVFLRDLEKRTDRVKGQNG